MRMLLLFVIAIYPAYAGVVHGVVSENITGYSLARARVRLQPIPKSGQPQGKPIQIRSGRSGQFAFGNVADGLYLLVDECDNYFPVAHGQRRPNGQGIPIHVTKDSQLFSTLRMRRKGAITGRVLDENGVAIPGVQVLAYRARLPLRTAGRGVSDDRGVYRIIGLDPGKYWVRTATYAHEDGSGRLPTFGPESRDAVQSRIHIAAADIDTSDADIRPAAGDLFRLSGTVQCPSIYSAPVTITLSTETGRQTKQADCAPAQFQFDGLAPAVYEIFATSRTGSEAGYTELYLEKDNDSGGVRMQRLPEVNWEFRRDGAPLLPMPSITLSGRREDLSNLDEARAIPIPKAPIAPGNWEISATPGSGQYIESIANTFNRRRRAWKVDLSADAYDVYIEAGYSGRLVVSISDKAAQITGAVTNEGAPVAGAPVFLWPVSEQARRSLRGWRSMLTTADGKFHFDGLPPGDYRMLATFDMSEVDADTMEEARAVTAHTAASQTKTIDLALWSAP
jgi:protocatechuate 3,4-dioxygenase beta subunit